MTEGDAQDPDAGRATEQSDAQAPDAEQSDAQAPDAEQSDAQEPDAEQEPEWVRRRRLEAAFGDGAHSQSLGDRWYRDQVPPHHG